MLLSEVFADVVYRDRTICRGVHLLPLVIDGVYHRHCRSSMRYSGSN
jgi:hypothetical protein